jgi:hypothetical protein
VRASSLLLRNTVVGGHPVADSFRDIAAGRARSAKRYRAQARSYRGIGDLDATRRAWLL